MSAYDNNDGYYDELGTQRRTGLRQYVSPVVKYVLALLLLVVLDAFWMKLLAPVWGVKYFEIVENIQGEPIAKRWEGLFAYLVLGYAAAFMTQAATPLESALQGAKIGFVIYAVFDFTTTFMFNDWSLKVAILDTIWGTLLYTAIGYILAHISSTSIWQRL